MFGFSFGNHLDHPRSGHHTSSLFTFTFYLAQRAPIFPGLTEPVFTLNGKTAGGVLAGAVYLCALGGDFADTVAAAARWNPAAAAVAGAILGAIHGEEAIPEDLLEELECAEVLRELGEDLYRGCPMMLGSKVFDIEWDEKYHSV